MKCVTRCVICNKKIKRQKVLEEFKEIFEQADQLGLESLTEQQQAAITGYVCSYRCYEKLV